MEIFYTLVGDYYLPNIVLSEPPRELTAPLGRYAHMRRTYLREHRPILYNRLLLTEKLYPHLREVDEAAQNRLTALADREIAHEFICSELVYN